MEDAISQEKGEIPNNKPQEEKGFDLTQEENKDRFLVARDGNNLTVLFRCDVYHFKNLRSKNPENSFEDVSLLREIRRANLDAFWARKIRAAGATKWGG